MQNKLLIVVDMQNDFITGALANKDAQAIVNPLADVVKHFDGALIFTCDTHDEHYAETQEGKKLPYPHCIYATKGWDIQDELMEAANTSFSKREVYEPLFLTKNTFGSLKWYGILTDYNNRCKYDEIQICGTCTDICVISNALILKAMFPETPIKVRANLCAGSTPEKHKAALDIMESCQIEVIYD